MKKLIAATLTLIAISTAHASNGGSPINYNTYPYLSAIIRVPRGRPNVAEVCLSTVTGKHSAITAAHCLKNMEKYESKNVYSYIDSMLKPFKIKMVSVHDNYWPTENNVYDVGVMYTAQNLSIKSLAVNTGFNAFAYLNAQPGKERLFTYFGLDKTSMMTKHEVDIRTGTLSVMSGNKCSDQIDDLLDHEGNTFDPGTKSELQNLRASLKIYPKIFFCVFNRKTDTIQGTAGDSGGPLIFNVGGQDYLVGTLTLGYDVSASQRYSGILLFTNMKHSYSFIDSCIHEELRQATRLSVAQSGYTDVNKSRDSVNSYDTNAQCPKYAADVPTSTINYLLLN